MFVSLRRILVAVLALAAGSLPAAAGPVLLYDTTGDRVLYAEDADHPWYAASLTKMMTAYLVFEAWKDGRATKEGKVVVSARANAQPKMRLGLGTGKELNYDHAVKALIMVSANDIAYAIAEAVSGSMEAFVDAMNAKAAALGMSGTRFVNPHGLPGRGQHTTAQDMARLAAALMRDYPEHLPYFGLTTSEIGDKRKRTIGAHNPVLVSFEGGDGFKTGFTCSAGYNIVASATRNGRRLVVVILGEETSAKRAVKMRALLDYGFKMMEWKALFPAATIHSLPGNAFDRERVNEINLDKRYRDCRDADPADSIAAEVAAAAALAGEAALRGVAVSGLTTGSVTPVAAATATAAEVKAAIAGAGANPAAVPVILRPAASPVAAPAAAPIAMPKATTAASPVRTIATAPPAPAAPPPAKPAVVPAASPAAAAAVAVPVPAASPATAAAPAPVVAAVPPPAPTQPATPSAVTPAAVPPVPPAAPKAAPAPAAKTEPTPAAKPPAKAKAAAKRKPKPQQADGVPFTLAAP